MMICPPRCALLFVAAAALACFTSSVDALAPRSDELDASYTFERYLVDFDKSYSEYEYPTRRAIYENNLDRILEHNGRYYSDAAAADSSNESPTHTLGINQFTDMKSEEVHKGFDKSAHDAFLLSTSSASATTTPSSVARTLLLEEKSHKMDLPFTIDDVSALPYSVDWRKEGVVSPVKDQGMCGSCWAFASTAVLESHIAIKTGALFDLSPQELVSCVPNPHKCGGDGGCLGATAELAYDWVSGNGHGILQEYQMGYSSYYGGNGECKSGNPGKKGPKFRGSVATIDGYSVCPTNDYKCVMNAVAKVGPVVVAVAASPWAMYESGVFASDLSKGGEATDLNHAVTLTGYGVDEQTRQPYWLVRNSWRPTWGEGGYIRLLRADPSTLDDPDNYCGMDTTPQDGMACDTDDDGKNIPPEPVKICGTSGVTFDAVMPVGGRRLH